MKPAVLVLDVVHGSVEVAQKPVLEKRIVDQVPLTTSIVVRLVVADTREVQPFGVAEFVAWIISKTINIKLRH
jgi:hypothetical protein